MEEYVGQIRKTRLRFYDVKKNRMGVKSRPMLIIKSENNTSRSDYTGLPVSKISDSRNIDEYFDEKITHAGFPNSNLDVDPSYIRCHKITTVSSIDVIPDEVICDFKNEYNTKYNEIISKTKEFINEVK